MSLLRSRSLNCNQMRQLGFFVITTNQSVSIELSSYLV